MPNLVFHKTLKYVYLYFRLKRFSWQRNILHRIYNLAVTPVPKYNIPDNTKTYYNGHNIFLKSIMTIH